MRYGSKMAARLKKKTKKNKNIIVRLQNCLFMGIEPVTPELVAQAVHNGLPAKADFVRVKRGRHWGHHQ